MGYDVYYRGEIVISPPLNTTDHELLISLINSATLDIHSDIEEVNDILQKIRGEFAPCYSFQMNMAEDKDALVALDNGEENEGLDDWLSGFIKYFFQPRGYSLDGSVLFDGEESTDVGVIYVKGALLESVDDTTFNSGPSWNPTPYASKTIRDAICDVMASADSTGYDGDLTVCSRSALEKLVALCATDTNPESTSCQS